MKGNKTLQFARGSHAEKELVKIWTEIVKIVLISKMILPRKAHVSVTNVDRYVLLLHYGRHGEMTSESDHV